MSTKITALRVQKRNQRRVNVYLDGRYAFALQAILAAPLKVGQALSPEEALELQRRDAAEAAYDRVLGFLSFRPRSRSEVGTYLARKKVPGDIVTAVVNRLEDAGLLDDEAFAQYWVENREAFRPRGSRSLQFELRRKGISSEVIERVTERIDEGASAYRAARERATRLEQLDYATFRQRLGGFLQRRGFSYDVIKDTVNSLWRERHSSAEAESGTRSRSSGARCFPGEEEP
jgi:regulatory protein